MPQAHQASRGFTKCSTLGGSISSCFSRVGGQALEPAKKCPVGFFRVRLEGKKQVKTKRKGCRGNRAPWVLECVQREKRKEKDAVGATTGGLSRSTLQMLDVNVQNLLQVLLNREISTGLSHGHDLWCPQCHVGFR